MAMARDCGLLFNLTHTKGDWKETIRHHFRGNPDGASPMTILIFDSRGNIYGTPLAVGLMLAAETVRFSSSRRSVPGYLMLMVSTWAPATAVVQFHRTSLVILSAKTLRIMMELPVVKLECEGRMSRRESTLAILLLSAQAAAQGVPVLQNPVASQSIVQPQGTSFTFSPSNEAGIVYAVGSYNWPPQSPNTGPSGSGDTVSYQCVGTETQ